MTPSSPAMSESGSTSRDQHEPAATTLGDLLYADKAKARVPEAAWVALVQAIAAGDQHALHTLFERMRRVVFILSMRITNNRETAEEVTLDVFHDVWRRAPAYDPSGGTVIGWIMNQTRSRALDRLRFELRKKRVNQHPAGPQPPSAANEPLAELHVKERERALRDALTVLTDAERRVIEAAFYSQLTYSQVAAQLGEPLGTIKTRARSGLEKLRQRLAGEAEER